MKILPVVLACLLFIGSAPTVAYKSVIDSTILKVHEVDWYADEEVQGHCSGIQIGVRWVLTMSHCIPDGNVDVLVDQRPVRIVKNDPKRDLALLETPEDVKVGGVIDIRKSETHPGETVIAIGYAWDEPIFTLIRTVGRVTDSEIFTDGSFIPGMSGGPVIDTDGKLVGVIWKGYRGDIGGAVSAKVVRAFLK